SPNPRLAFGADFGNLSGRDGTISPITRHCDARLQARLSGIRGVAICCPTCLLLLVCRGEPLVGGTVALSRNAFGLLSFARCTVAAIFRSKRPRIHDGSSPKFHETRELWQRAR